MAIVGDSLLASGLFRSIPALAKGVVGMNRRRVTSVCLLVLLAVSMFVGSVAAEGTRYSSMYDVQPGFNFRNYYDSNSDGVSSWVYLGGCYLSNPNLYLGWVKLTLWEVNSWAPDYPKGYNYFYGDETRYWGDMPSHTYHFTVTDFDESGWYNRLSCNTVNYGW